MNKTMKQVVLTAPELFEFKDVPIPKPQEGEALLKVKSIGICGSDIHTYYGKHPFVHPPIVLGHEVCGEIMDLNSKNSEFKVGDQVVIRPQRTCGTCRPCKNGRYNICDHLNVLGCLSTGAASEYFSVETSLLYKLPNHLSPDAGTILEPLAVGVHAIRRGGNAQGKNVLICGAGTIGNVTAQAAKALGAKAVMITDISDYKLNVAKECGIDYTVNVKHTSLKDAVNNCFGREEIDLILECSALESVLNQAIDIAPKGINIVIVGVFESVPKVDMAAVQDREYSLIGTLMYTHQDYKDAIDMAGNHLVHLEKLITRRFPFEQYPQAYKYIEANRDNTLKVIIQI